MTTPAMQYIVRVDRARNHGYRVRLQRRAALRDKPTVASEFFSDSLYGGKRGALTAAKRFRDAAVEVQPPARRVPRKPPVSGKSRGKKGDSETGYGYVRLMTLGARGTGPKTEVYYAEYVSPSGKRQHNKFSVVKHGAVKAMALADGWLKAQFAAAKARGEKLARPKAFSTRGNS